MKRISIVIVSIAAAFSLAGGAFAALPAARSASSYKMSHKPRKMAKRTVPPRQATSQSTGPQQGSR